LKLRKIVLTAVVIVTIVTGYFSAKIIEASGNTSYSGAISRLQALGVMNPDEYGSEGLDGYMTRGEFAKAFAIASGLEDNARAIMGSTIFPDVDPGSLLSGYINALVAKDLMTGMSDGKFHPEGIINFAQACTMMVKALGYTDSDLTGTWPRNYILKAKTLSLTGGISFNNTEKLPRWAVAIMLDRLLETSIKSDPNKTYADYAGISKESYQFGLISNPVYSAPEIVTNFNPQISSKIGAIDLSGDVKIVRNGQIADITDIEENDVVYEVRDLWGTKRYIQVVDNKVEGEITAISPNSIQIEGKDYIFSSSTVFNKMSNSSLGFKVGDAVTVLLGYDGKVVDYFDIKGQDNSNFAFVVNYTDNVKEYTVKLLMIDGCVRTYKVTSNPWYKKGKLVSFKMINDETVELTDLPYSNPGDIIIDKENRKIGDNYVAHNVKIFSLITNSSNLSTDANVQLVKWSDLPSGKISSDRIQYMNKTGAFGDINVVVINDVFSENYKTAVVKSLNYTGPEGNQTLSSCTVVIDGKESTIKPVPGATSGSVLKVKTTGSGSIENVMEIRTPVASPAKVEAIDLTRIKVNGITYEIKSNVQVYFRDWAGGFTLKKVSDIEAGKEYNSVSVYLDKPLYYGGKVDTIIVQ